MDTAFRTLYRCSLTYNFLFCLNFTLHEWRRPSFHGPKSQDQDRDRDSRVPRPRPRPRLWGSKTETKTKTPRFKTKTETKTCKNGSWDVSRPRPKSRELQVWKHPMRVSNFGLKIWLKVEFCPFLRMHSIKLAENTWNHQPVKLVPELTYNVSSGTLSLYTT